MGTNTEQLSLALSSIRAFLMGQDFFETHIYSTVTYKIENTDTFTLKENLFLRVNPEPDIWTIGDRYDRFFWIGSLFRNEKRLTNIHSYEFTVVDIYEVGPKENTIKRFIGILEALEHDLGLHPLTKDIVEIDYTTHIQNISPEECWILVNNYPKEESFYDTINSSGMTNKFELFYKKRRKHYRDSSLRGTMRQRKS